MIYTLIYILLLACFYTLIKYKKAVNTIGELRSGKYLYIPGRGVPKFYSLKNREFNLEKIPTSFFVSLFLHEDNLFLSHKGFNIPEILNAFCHYFRTGKIRGGSSITQQTAKNILTSGNISIKRKLDEAIYTLALENMLNKEEILYLYLATMKLNFPVTGINQIIDYLGISNLSAIKIPEFELIFSLLPSPTRHINKLRHLGPSAYSYSLSYEKILILKKALKKANIPETSFGITAHLQSLKKVLANPLLGAELSAELEKPLIIETIFELSELQKPLNRIILHFIDDHLTKNLLTERDQLLLHLLNPQEMELAPSINLSAIDEHDIISIAIHNKILNLLSLEKANKYGLKETANAIAFEIESTKQHNILAISAIESLLEKLENISAEWILFKEYVQKKPSKFDSLSICTNKNSLKILLRTLMDKGCLEIRTKKINRMLTHFSLTLKNLTTNIYCVRNKNYNEFLYRALERESTTQNKSVIRTLLHPKDSFLLECAAKPIYEHSSILESLNSISLCNQIEPKDIERELITGTVMNHSPIVVSKLLEYALFNIPVPSYIDKQLIKHIYRPHEGLGNLLITYFSSPRLPH